MRWLLYFLYLPVAVGVAAHQQMRVLARLKPRITLRLIM